jgi:hypothetical protein
MPGSGLCDGCLPKVFDLEDAPWTGGVGPGVELGSEGDEP